MHTMRNGAKKVKVNVVKDEPVPETIDLEREIDGSDKAVDNTRTSARTEPDWKEKYLRLAADLDNTKKRMAQTYARKAEQEKEQLLIEFLDVVDNLELALDHADSSDRQALVDGVKTIQRQIQQLLSNHGVRPFRSEGKPFDPERHEAISVIGRNDIPANTVAHVARTGYYHRDRVLRPARVVVNTEG